MAHIQETDSVIPVTRGNASLLCFKPWMGHERGSRKGALPRQGTDKVMGLFPTPTLPHLVN